MLAPYQERDAEENCRCQGVSGEGRRRALDTERDRAIVANAGVRLLAPDKPDKQAPDTVRSVIPRGVIALRHPVCCPVQAGFRGG